MVYFCSAAYIFEWQDNQHLVESGYLRNMRLSSTMIEVEREVKQAKDANAGPYFFGPRVDFNYAVLGVPSPEHSPAWWEPGTAFSVSDQARLIQVWQEHRFQTLIFLKVNNPWHFEPAYYPPELFDAIRRGYVEDTSYPVLTIYHRRSAESDQP